MDGVAMGSSPLGPILADLFMSKLENGVLTGQIEKLNTHYRYIDDTFILVDEHIDPVALKELNKFLQFSARLAEANALLDFINQCVHLNQYPKSYWKSVRRSKIHPNSKSLKRHALSHVDSVTIQISDLDRNVSQYRTAVDDLPDHIRSDSVHYINDICVKRSQTQRVRLLKGLDK